MSQHISEKIGNTWKKAHPPPDEKKQAVQASGASKHASRASKQAKQKVNQEYCSGRQTNRNALGRRKRQRRPKRVGGATTRQEKKKSRKRQQLSNSVKQLSAKQHHHSSTSNHCSWGQGVLVFPKDETRATTAAISPTPILFLVVHIFRY